MFLDDKDLVQSLQGDGWNIRFLKPRDEYEEAQAYLQVSVKFGRIPPKIHLISNGKKTMLDEDSIDLLDWAEFDNIDLIIRPYNYEVSGMKGVKAYLKTMYATLTQNEFAAKYENIPDNARSSTFGN